MSLGENTKCDLSAGIAKLDIEALTNQVENHFYSLVSQMSEKTDKIRASCMTKEERKDTLLSMTAHGSKTIMQLSKQIAETVELLYTLYESGDRHVEIINNLS